MNCTCQFCEKEYIYKGLGGTKTICNSCITNRRRIKIKIEVIKLMGGACLICGFNKCLGALVFHHLDPKQKLFSISGNHSVGWLKLKSELEKCILLCANCHSQFHHDCDKYGCECASILVDSVPKYSLPDSPPGGKYTAESRAKKKIELLEKKKNTSKIFKLNTIEKNNKRKQIVLNSNINFNKHGWCGKLAKLFNMSHGQSARKWMIKNMPEFYEKHCSKPRQVI